VGDTLRPSIEKIVALNPDLVIASTSSQLEQAVRKLDEIGLAVYVSNPRNLPGVVESIESLGRVLGDPDTAREVVMNMNQRIDAVRRNVDGRGRPRVLLVLGGQPLITVGAGSFITDLISLAGGESISANESFEYPQYSLETALARRPEIIFLQSGDEPLPERLKQTPAYQSGRIYRLDDALLLRPGPRLVEGLEQLAGKIHPEAFAAARVAEQ
jgi:iron complex transport system substrate-binding protein